MTKHRDWLPELETITEMAAKGMRDAEIGKIYGVTAQAIGRVRHRFNIPTKSTRGGYKVRKPAPPPPVPEPELPVEDGVKQCPTRFADGLPTRITAKARR